MYLYVYVFLNDKDKYRYLAYLVMKEKGLDILKIIRQFFNGYHIKSKYLCIFLRNFLNFLLHLYIHM